MYKLNSLFKFQTQVHDRFLRFMCNWISNQERIYKSHKDGCTELVINFKIIDCYIITQN